LTKALEAQGIQFLDAGQVALGNGVALKEWHFGHNSTASSNPAVALE
jgi:hypothetical protein